MNDRTGVRVVVDYCGASVFEGARSVSAVSHEVEWGGRGVTVNAVAPTVILTPLGERVWGDPARGEPMRAKIPLGRFGQPVEVAAIVAFLASDLASLINGETIAADGGYTAQ